MRLSIHQNRVWLLLLSATLIASLSSCRKKSAKTDACKSFSQRSRVTISIPVEPPHLCDLLKSTYWIRHISLNLILEPLVREDPRTYRIVAGLADSWSFSADRKQLTFKLKKGVRFHDGKPMTADDVIFTLDTLMDKSFPNGVKREDFGFLESWKKLGSHTVQIRLKRVDAFTLLGFTDLQIYPRHRFAGKPFGAVCGKKTLIGTGPYRLKSWRDQLITLERSAAYHGSPPAIKTLIFRKVDPKKLPLVLKRGEIDAVPGLQQDQLKALSSPALKGRFSLFRHPGNTYGLLGFNLKQPKFKHPDVRRGFARLVDLEKIRTRLFKSLARPALGPFHLLSAATPKLKPALFDAKQGRKLLASGGWRDTDKNGVLEFNGKPISLRLLYRGGSKQHRRIAAYLQDQLKRFGIPIQLKPLSWGKLLKALPAGDYDLFLFRWGPIPYHYDLYPFFHSRGSFNWIGLNDKQVDRWIEKARTILDEQRRLAIYYKVADKLYRNQVVQFHFVPQKLVVAHRCLEGIYPSALGLQFRDWAIKTK